MACCCPAFGRTCAVRETNRTRCPRLALHRFLSHIPLPPCSLAYDREGCPRLLVMIQGARAVSWASNQVAPDLSPGLNLMGVREKPIRLSHPAKVVYAPAVSAPSEHMLPACEHACQPAFEHTRPMYLSHPDAVFLLERRSIDRLPCQHATPV